MLSTSLLPRVTAGVFTITSTASLKVIPLPSRTVRVYVLLAVGVTVGLRMLVELNSVAGLQE